jgi:hypothetical protein
MIYKFLEDLDTDVILFEPNDRIKEILQKQESKKLLNSHQQELHYYILYLRLKALVNIAVYLLQINLHIFYKEKVKN